MATLEKRGKNTYRLREYGGRDSNNKKWYISEKTIKVPPELKGKRLEKYLEKEKALFVADCEKGIYYNTASNMTLEQCSQRWLLECERTLKGTTVADYKDYLNNGIIEKLGHYRIKEVSPLVLEDFFNYLTTKKKKRNDEIISTTTQKHYYIVLSALFNYAYTKDIIPTNPMHKVTPPRVEKKEKSSYTVEEIGLLYKELDNEPIMYKTLIILTVNTGLRLGEVTGLKWSDIKGNVLHISRNNQYLPGKGTIISDTKTSTSNRTIPIDQVCMNLLHEWRKEQRIIKETYGSGYVDEDWVFTQLNGKVIHHDTPSKWFRKFLKRKELRPITFHELRHTHATLLLNNGLPLTTVKERLGHSSATVTLDFYAHAMREKDNGESCLINNLVTSQLQK